jgi:YfiR/HmsC-like
VALLSRRQRPGRNGNSTSEDSEFPASVGPVGRSVGLILLFLICAGTMAPAQSPPLSEYEIKAGFLFNFAKFVDWPPDAFADLNAPIVMGIVGDNPVIELLTETAVGKTVKGRAVVVRRLKEGQDLRGCHILFVSLSEGKHIPQILESLKGSRALTVGETSGFTQSGGMINFFVEGSRVRLEINLDAATRARVRISAKVIAVARLVTEDSAGGKS